MSGHSLTRPRCHTLGGTLTHRLRIGVRGADYGAGDRKFNPYFTACDSFRCIGLVSFLIPDGVIGKSLNCQNKCGMVEFSTTMGGAGCEHLLRNRRIRQGQV